MQSRPLAVIGMQQVCLVRIKLSQGGASYLPRDWDPQAFYFGTHVKAKTA